MQTPPGFWLVLRFNPTAGTYEYAWHNNEPLIAWGQTSVDALRAVGPIIGDQPANFPLLAVRAFAVLS